MYTGTRLTTAINRRLFSRFFLKEGERLCTGYNALCMPAFVKRKRNVAKEFQDVLKRER